jgi:hypothetical protein
VPKYLAFVLLATGAACGGSQAKVKEPAVVAVDAATDAPKVVIERPFAATPLAAQTMIQAQIEGRMKALWQCVEDYRARAGDPHRGVTVNIGIDQEGHLFGVTSDTKRGDLDPTIKACMLEALRTALFPRSHTGVIAVRQVFQDAPAYR